MKFQTDYESPWASCLNIIKSKTGEWRFQRPVTKVSKCRQCGWCFIYCPCGCREVKETHFDTNLDYCKGCGICARTCPAKAIALVREEE
jgi:2-oxoacid:acceptor oxidoreductase delta subunit (pyruvate/2-ketoisovalerate family)